MAGPAALLVVGLSHQTAALAAREQVALDDARARAVLRGLRDDPSVHEVAVLSTCNRTEIYAVAESAEAGEQALRRALLERSSLGAATLACAAYALHEHDVAEHLCRVAAGLESAILGETEIGGQVRSAARRARQEGALGPVLSGMFDHALAAARRVRRQTGISAGATSVASVVVELLGRAPGSRRVVLLGAGGLARSLAGALAAVTAVELVILNRTHAAAAELADRHGATAAGLDRLDAELARADAIVCATDAPLPLVSVAAVARAVGTSGRALRIVDLAVPRDVDPSAADVPGVTVHDIDAVQQMVGRNLAARRRAARTATAMVHREAERFSAWRRELDAAPAVRSVWRQAEQLRRDELARVADALTAEEHDRLERVTASLLVKLLHGPCERLRAACVGPDGATQVENFRMLFGVGSDGHGEATNVITMPRRGAA